MHDSFKLFVARAAEERRRFLSQLAVPEETDAAFLLGACVAVNRDTAFGRDHGFDKIRTVDDYRAAVPIRSYDEFAPWIERAASGERAVLTRNELIAFNRTSGTSGPNKLIPVTLGFEQDHELKRLLISWGNLIEQHPEAVERLDATWTLPGDSRSSPSTTAGGIPVMAVSERVGAQEILRSCPGATAPWIRPPIELGPAERGYFKLRIAVEHDVRVIFCLNPSTLTMLSQTLTGSLEQLARDVHDGTAFGSRIGGGNPDRARFLLEKASHGSEVLPRHVWPRLSAIQCWKSAACALYLPSLSKAYGDEVEVLPHTLSASEGTIALPVDRHPVGLVLALGSSFLEFLPAGTDSERHTDTLLFGDLEEGREYEVVLTQSSGLYRYAIGDVVRVVGRHGRVPRVELVARRSVVGSFAGEKLTEQQVVAAARAALEERGLQAVGITCCPIWDEPPHYDFAVETMGACVRAELEALARALDSQLGLHNDEYPGKRATGRLAPPRVHLVGEGTFERRRLQAVATGGASANQVKDRMVEMDETRFRELLLLSGVPILTTFG